MTDTELTDELVFNVEQDAIVLNSNPTSCSRSVLGR